MHKSLDENILEMKRTSHFLMNYSFPKVPPEDEDDINILKVRDVCVDGYDVVLHYSKTDYDNYFLETLQILGKYSSFLPFALVCKIGKRFLGENYLSLVEVFKDNRKIYCWTRVSNYDGESVQMPNQEDARCESYEGLEYVLIDPQDVNFY